MTSIRSFSEILMQADPVDDAARTRFSRIIHDESLRLTRLLDDLLDLSVLENGLVTLHRGETTLRDVLDPRLLRRGRHGGGRPHRHPPRRRRRRGHAGDRSRPADAGVHQPHLQRPEILRRRRAPSCASRSGAAPTRSRSFFCRQRQGPFPARQRSLIFEKFARLDTAKGAPGAGLGLAISREIMARLGGQPDLSARRRHALRGAPAARADRCRRRPLRRRIETSLTGRMSEPAHPRQVRAAFSCMSDREEPADHAQPSVLARIVAAHGRPGRGGARPLGPADAGLGPGAAPCRRALRRTRACAHG